MGRKEVFKVNSTEQKHGSASIIVAVICCLLTAGLLLCLLFAGSANVAYTPLSVNLRSTFERNLNNQMSDVLDGIVTIHRTYQLNDSDLVAPEPNPACYGQVDSPAQMQAILDQAAVLLDGQDTLFTVDTVIKAGSKITYYLDETIFAVTWKQVEGDCVYTFSEVKIAHASQFRRFLSGGKYNSSILHTTTEMSESVNAVVASSGDYYGYRSFGIVVNEGQVYRDRGHLLDTCFIDENGDMNFIYAGDMIDQETIQKYVDEHNIRFSICFGPVMILGGEYCVPSVYNSGEISDPHARAALCQMGKLHYVVVDANSEDPHYSMPTLAQFGQRLHAMGIPTAYALDGGQTATIVMNDQLINTVSYGHQREISDIFYFATALPED